MTMNEEEKKNENKSEGSEHESDDENEILEESPCGRWLKRSEEVSQRNVPGIDRAYLAMDSEEGVEVVWNEVQFSERKSFNKQEEKIKSVFDNLMKIDHANIVKFHRYWIDYPKEQQKTRVVFITEYMSSGSVKEFLNKTKELQSSKRNKSWKRWCTQILSALNYLHSCNPPVIHGNMTCDTIFIQHNGLVKIGSVAPDAIRNHVKTYQEVKHLHYYAPEYETALNITPAVDIFSFGICALEMAVPRFHLQHQSKTVTPAVIENAINMLENPQQKDFIRLCLRDDPTQRPSARSLLLHPLLFEVHSLKLLSAHAFVKNQRILPEYKQAEQSKEVEIAKTCHRTIKLKDIPVFDIDKFLEDVLNGVYPLTSYAMPQPLWVPTETTPQQTEGQTAEGHKPTSNRPTEEIAAETRKIIFAQGTITPLEKSRDDKMNRHLNCEMTSDDSADVLATELMEHKLIREGDKGMITQLLEDLMTSQHANKGAIHLSCGHYGSEHSIDVPGDLVSALSPVNEPLDQSGYVFYQGQALSKTQVTNGGFHEHTSALNMTPVFQHVPQNSVVLPTASNPAQYIGTSVLPQPQQVAVPSQADNPLSATSNLAKQLASHQAATVVPMHVPVQYFPILQPQTAQPATSIPNQVQAIPNMIPYQTSLVSQPMLQPIYAHQLQGQAITPLLTQFSPALTQQLQIAPGLVQSVPAHNIITSGVANQTRPRAPTEQRNAQSNNNSNNTVFSRSTSRVDDPASQHLVQPGTTNSNDAELGTFNMPPPTPTTTTEPTFKAT